MNAAAEKEIPEALRPFAEAMRPMVREEVERALAAERDALARARDDERSSRDAQEWLTAKEAAARLRVSTRLVAKLAATKRIPARRVGRLWRFSAADVEQYAKSNAEGA